MIDENIYRILEAIILVSLMLIVVYNYKIIKKKLIFKYNVFYFILIPFLSAFGALIFHNQPLDLSIIVLRINFFWLLYFVLHAFDIPTKKIINLMLTVGVIWASLTIIQQFTYPEYYFYSRNESETYSILRSGVYRFMIYGQQYGVFFLLFLFYRYLLVRKMYLLIFLTLGLLGLYYYGTRQFAISAGVCMFIAMLFVKGKARMQAGFIMLIGVALILFFKEELFGDYIELTTDQLQYGNGIRQLSASFFLNDYWPHWTAKIIGNGSPHMLSSYGSEMEVIRDYFHFYRSDVGIIGAFNQYGILYVLNILWVNIKGLKSKYFTYNNNYLRLLFINCIILLFVSEFYSKGLGIPFYCLLFYLTDKSFEEKNLHK